ncbi:hypothetical protein Lal_00031902 [Lupinus albus]|nr:hypothetical protein Lal_00031902 [Lupinus albus]
MTPFVISNLEHKMLHNIVSPHASSHPLTSNMIYVLLVSSNIASERSNKNDVTKDVFERRVFDPGGGVFECWFGYWCLWSRLVYGTDWVSVWPRVSRLGWDMVFGRGLVVCLHSYLTPHCHFGFCHIMEQSRPKRVKTSATRVRRREVGSPSARDRGDPYYSLILQETRMAKFQGRKPTYIRSGNYSVHGIKGQVYPALVREFYANFRYKDGKYWSMISGNLFELNDEIFMNVGGLSSSGYSIGDCSWKSTSLSKRPSFIHSGSTDQSWSLSVENRLLHYIIAYILVQRNTNHAQPTVNDLRFMYAVKNNVMINWPEEILKIMNSVSLSQSKLLPYSIFISRIVDYLRIDVSDTIIVEYTDKDHLVGESLIHKMGIYKYGSTWQYQEDYTTFGLDLSDDDNQDDTDNQHATAQGEPSGSAPQKSAFGFDQLEAMEQRLNNRMDLHFQGLKTHTLLVDRNNSFRYLRIISTLPTQSSSYLHLMWSLSSSKRGD